MPGSNFELQNQHQNEPRGTAPVFPNQQMPAMFRQPQLPQGNGQIQNGNLQQPQRNLQQI